MSRQRKRPHKSPLVVPATAAADAMRRRMAEFLEFQLVRNYSEASVFARAKALNRFADWCDERGLLHPAEVTKPILERYQRHLFMHRKSNGKPLGAGTQNFLTTAVRVFFRWLTRQNFLLYNPASELELPRVERRLPKAVLSPQETDRVLALPDLGTPLGVRDRAIMETLYSTGMRRKELVELSVFGVDAERGTVMIRQGKGKKDRVVPIGEQALAWVAKYLDEVRPNFVMPPDNGILFLTADGQAFDPGHLSSTVRYYVEKAELAGKRGSCHLFRHTCATLMLEGGADIRFIQALLGHAKLDTTQIYTQVSIRKLKEIHSATHPSAKLERAGAEQPRQRGDADQHRDAEPPKSDVALRDELLSSLVAEAAEEEGGDDGEAR